MERLLPIFVGGQPLTIRLLPPEAIGSLAPEDRAPILGLLARIGRPASDLDAATATGGVSVVDLRVDGIKPDDLAAGYIAAMQAAAPGATTSIRTVDGHRITRLRWPVTTPLIDIHVVVANNVVYAFGALPDDQDAVDRAVRYLGRPRLDLILPESIGGRPLTRYAAPGAAFDTGGDVCSIVCPGEVRDLSKRLKVSVDAIDVAVGYLATMPPLVIVAFRVQGARDDRLVAARVAMSDGPFGASDVSIGGRAVTWVAHSPLPSPASLEYLFAKDGVLFSIRPAPEQPDKPSAEAVAAIRALP